ncbi:TetR/AcrR family transcriptional regulator [Pseudoalteromonas sp. 5Ae-yellow]|uniref:TetR/AcrR family transcriptional regulator n=1 Tax=Pseudoalteromonas sp. 5Ae-yellow TaxID=2759847 RepID=UPI0015F4B968|nr:TetR/AcrR family transcriptional regulator [Pseudoalteromonas sp. 5Ae-yellow]MBA6410272.1 TetR/AcrR family transcriptional regulator [Pseudoalteromonas sp. 5Ae-yellow]
MKFHQADTRQRMVKTAAEMLAQHGLNATSIREMSKRAKSPLGSTYHHFPDGKQQVVVEAVVFAGEKVAASLDHHLRKGAALGIREFLGVWRVILLESNFRIGCPVLAVAVEEPLDEVAENTLKAAAIIFNLWEEKLAAALIAEGSDLAAASGIATLVVAAAEGAIALCRAQRSIDPFDRVEGQLLTLLTQV